MMKKKKKKKDDGSAVFYCRCILATCGVSLGRQTLEQNS